MPHPVLFLCLVFLWPALSAAARDFALADDSASGALELHARSAVLIDAATGVVIYEKNADDPIPPASLTKLVTMEVALDEASRIGMRLDMQVRLPRAAWARNQPPRSSLMGLDDGQYVTLRDLLLGLAIPSGNDAAVAVALNFADDIPRFAGMMNDTVQKLGLKATHFVEPSGISEENITTAREFAVFCKNYIRRYPENLMRFHSVRRFDFPRPENLPPSRHRNPRTITRNNHIGPIWTYPGADGLKTGYIDESGYNLALTAERDGTRFIAVILGVPSEYGSYRGPRARDADGSALLSWGYERYRTLRVEYPQFVKARVWKGKKSLIDVVPYMPDGGTAPVGAFTIDKERGGELSFRIEMYSGVCAPLEEGGQVGDLILLDSEGELGRLSLGAAESVPPGNIFKRFFDTIGLFLTGLFS